MTLQTTLHEHLVRFLVGKVIFCPRTGQGLDARTCVVLVDGDGDPCTVLSQEGWAEIAGTDTELLLRDEYGLTVDPATIKEA